MLLACALLAAALAPRPASAKVPLAEAEKLGGELTPLGALRAGNREGTIPPWTGGITQPPADWDPDDWHPDPFDGDEVLFSIKVENVEQHAEHLTAGHQALLGAYHGSWRMNVYPTRRSASFPTFVYEAIRENATRAEVVLEGKGSVLNTRLGSPFPIPASGLEAIWNHNLRWRGVRVDRTHGTAAVTREGRYRVILASQELAFPYGDPRDSAFKLAYPNLMLAIKTKTVAPALRAGDGSLVIEPIDQTHSPRKAWSYRQALRRVLRQPFFGYEFPDPNSENLRTIDDAFLFNGPPDRFDWRLLGKREIYVPYNAYRLHAGDVGPRDILRVGHIDPELARYELHRVWVVEATLKPGQRHVYSRRVFYLDEDSWRILVSESYDSEGVLWRIAEAHTVNHYQVPVLLETLEVYHDLKERRYLAVGLDNGLTPPRFEEKTDPREFTPNALLYYIR